LKKFKQVSIDTLKVYSAEDLESNSYKYKGKPLDSVDIALFPKEISGLYESDSSFYACYQFNIDSTRIGLITRTPSEYISSSIKLFLFDKKADAITNYFELADQWGDAGDALDKTAWIVRDRKKNIQAFLWVNETLDNSVEDETDSTIESNNYYYLVDLSKQAIDTTNNDSAKLTRQFQALLK